MFTLNDLYNELLPEQRVYMRYLNPINADLCSRFLVSFISGQMAIGANFGQPGYEMLASNWVERTPENYKMMSEIVNELNRMLDVYKMVSL